MPSRMRLRALWLVAMIGALALMPVGQARADGGAPNLAYISGAGASGQSLAIVDIAKRQVVGTVALGERAWGVVLSADSRFVYVTLPGAGQLAIIDAHAQQVSQRLSAGAGAQSLAILQAKTTLLYVADTEGDTVTVIDPDHSETVATIPVGAGPRGIAVANAGSGIASPSDPEVYVANTQGDSVSIISSQQQRVIMTVPVPGGPIGVSVPMSGGVAYVTTSQGAVVAISLADHRVLGTLMQRDGAAYGAMDYDAITGRVYLPDEKNNAVYVLTPASAGSAGSTPRLPDEPSRTLNYTGGPSATAITFDGAFGFVTLADAGQVAMFDVPTRQTLATIDVGGTPHGVVTGAYPPVFDRQTSFIAGIGFTILILIGVGIVGYVLWRGDRKRKGETNDAPTVAN